MPAGRKFELPQSKDAESEEAQEHANSTSPAHKRLQSASHSGRLVDAWRIGLVDFPVSATGIRSVPLCCSLRSARIGSNDLLADRLRRERRTVVGAGSAAGSRGAVNR